MHVTVVGASVAVVHSSELHNQRTSAVTLEDVISYVGHESLIIHLDG